MLERPRVHVIYPRRANLPPLHSQPGVVMNHSLQTYRPGHADEAVSAGQRNRVLRNTYWLLALSMVPTVLGAWLGVATGITSALSPGIGIVVFLAGAFGFMFAIEKT